MVEFAQRFYDGVAANADFVIFFDQAFNRGNPCAERRQNIEQGCGFVYRNAESMGKGIDHGVFSSGPCDKHVAWQEAYIWRMIEITDRNKT